MSRTRGVKVIRWNAASLLALALLIVVAATAAQPVHAAGNVPVNATLGHFAPFSDSEERALLDVAIDGKPAANELGYLEQVQGLLLETGVHSIVAEPTEWAAGVFTDTFDVPAPGAGSLVDPGVLLAVNGGTSGIPLNVAVMAVEQAAPTSGALVRFTRSPPMRWAAIQNTRYAIRTARLSMA